MPVLRFLENLAKGAANATGLPYFINTDIINPIKQITAEAHGNEQAYQNAGAAYQRPIGQQLQQLGGNTASLALTAAAPGISSAAENAVGLEGASGITGNIAKGIVGGASVGGSMNVSAGIAQGQTAPKELALNFLTGTVGGAVIGGVGGGVGGAISDAKAARLAKLEDPTKIEAQLKPDVGPVVARDVASTVAQTNDPAIVKNVVQQDIDRKVPSPPPSTAQDATTPSVSEPVNPGQGSEQLANVNPQEAQKYADTFGISQEQATQDLQKPTSTELNKTTDSLNDPLKKLQTSLGTGEPVEEAVNRYIDETGASLSQAKKAVGDIISSANFPKGQVNSKLNPRWQEAQGLIPKASSNDEILNNIKVATNATLREGDKTLAEYNKLSPEDKALAPQLVGASSDQIKTLAEQTKDPEQFTRFAEANKARNDLAQATGAGVLGERTPYRTDYGSSLLVAPKEGSQEAIEAAQTPGRAGLKVNAAYSLPRNIQNYTDAEAAGYHRLFSDYGDEIAYDTQRRANNFRQLALHKGLTEVYPGQVAAGRIGTLNGSRFTELGDSGLSVPKGVAESFGGRLDELNPTGKALGTYDNLNSQIKNMKLAGGGFHSLNVTGTYVAQQLASGKAFTARGASDLGTLIKSTFSQDAFESKVSQLEQKGRLVDFDAIGMTTKTPEISADVASQGLASKIPILNQIHDSIFGRQIPMMKMLIADQKLDGMGFNRNDPELLQQGIKIGKELNQNFGGINRDIQGLTPQNFKRAARVFLSTDYNEGQLRTLYDAFSKGGPDGTLARQAVFGKALLFGGLATAGGAVGGEFQGQTPKQVAFDILHKVADPSFQFGSYKVGLPTTQVSELVKPISQTVSGLKAGQGALQGAQDFATARLAAIPSAVEQIGTNKNFYGQKMFGTDKFGRPIAATKGLSNVASTFLPIPLSQGIQTATGSESKAAAVANTIGLRVTPKTNVENLPVGQQTYIKQAQQAGADSNQVNAISDFFGTLRQSAKDRSSATKTAQQDLVKGDNAGAQKAITDYNQQLLSKLKPWLQKNSQYMDNAMYAQLTQNFSSPFTATGVGLLKLPSLNTLRKDVQANPLKYGLAISGSNTNGVK